MPLWALACGGNRTASSPSPRRFSYLIKLRARSPAFVTGACERFRSSRAPPFCFIGTASFVPDFQSPAPPDILRRTRGHLPSHGEDATSFAPGNSVTSRKQGQKKRSGEAGESGAARRE